MTTQDNLSQALIELCSLPHDDPRLAWLAREFNLFTEVLRDQGKRERFTATDLHVIFTRMLDIAQVKPLPSPTSSEPERKQIPVNLDNLDAAMKGPEVFKLKPPKREPSL